MYQVTSRAFALGTALTIAACAQASEERTDPDTGVGTAHATIPAGLQRWETIPSVIRDDGVDSFRLEVEPNRDVVSIVLTPSTNFLVFPADLELRDDGANDDLAAGDGIYTLGPIRFNTATTMPSHFEGNADSPAGVYMGRIGEIVITEVDEVEGRHFRIHPEHGLLRSDIAATAIERIDSAVSVASHVIGLNSNERNAQRTLRIAGGSLTALTQPIYDVLGDDFDHLIISSAGHVENAGGNTSANFNAGMHYSIKVDFDNTGHTLRDNTANYGSAGKLASINLIDTLGRGWHSNNLVHELLHQWGGRTPTNLGLQNDAFHYHVNTNIGSLIGGLYWADNGDDTFTLECQTAGRGGATYASPLDLYMMGLVDASAVAPIRKHTGNWWDLCDQVIPEIETTVTIGDLQTALGGVRSPGPATSQKDFRLGFVVESYGRDLTDTELTFYNIFAEHSTRPIVGSDPRLAHNWVPIGSYFGHGTTWRSDVPYEGEDDGGFDWGDDPCAGGTGDFSQAIPYRETVDVGVVPAALGNVEIYLNSSVDVDVQLIDEQTGHEIIAWPNGDLNGPGEECTIWSGVQYCYSGYNGVGGELGNEWIKVTGDTNRPVIMKAYGYQAGDADIEYTWTAASDCVDTGSGSFTQFIPEGDAVLVGDIPTGKRNIRIDLASPEDVDIQLIDATNGHEIIAWPSGDLNGAGQESTTYDGMIITYSGYNGINGEKGHEFITVRGTVSAPLTMKAFGYAAGDAQVDYAWGLDDNEL
jgi:hypothetical protein